MIENSVEQSFVRWCNRNGLICEKLTSPKKGWPDRCVLLRGAKVVWLEFKHPKGGKLSPHQKSAHEKIRTAGHVVSVPRTVEEAIKAIK